MSPMSMGILVLLPLSAFEGTAILPSAAVALTKARLASARIMAVLDRADAEHVEGNRAWPEDGGPECARVAGGLARGKGDRTAVGGSSSRCSCCRRRREWIGKDHCADDDGGTAAARRGNSFVLTRWTFRISIRPSCVGTWGTSPRTHTSSRRRYLRTCASHAVTSPSRTRRKHLPQSVSASGWRNCRTGSTPTWSAACERFRAVSVRRLLLARAIVSPAEVLLLDEPTEHMDAEAGDQLLRELLSRDASLVDSSRTVVVVTHQLPDGTAADQVICVGKVSVENTLPSS